MKENQIEDNKGRTVGFRGRRWAKVDGNFTDGVYTITGPCAAAVSVQVGGIIKCKSDDMNADEDIALVAGQTVVVDIRSITETGTTCTGITLYFVD